MNQAYYDYRLTEDGREVQHGHTAADYSTDMLAAKAVDFIRTAAGRPFFLELALHAPHQEGFGSLPVSAPRHMGLFEGVWPSHAISYDEADVTDKPAWIQTLPRAGAPLGATFLTYGVWADLVQQYSWGALQAVDDAVAAVVAALQAIGQDDNTVIVFVSDNGYFDGEHRAYARKNYPYEEGMRVPLIVRFPKATTAARSESSMVVNVDLAPTLAEIAEVVPPSPVDGRSVVALLSGSAASTRPDFRGARMGRDRVRLDPPTAGTRHGGLTRAGRAAGAAPPHAVLSAR